MSILSLLVTLILIGLLFWGVRVIADAMAIPPQIVAVIHVLLVIIVVIWILQLSGLVPGVIRL